MAETTLAPTQQQKDLSSVLAEIEKRKIAGTFTPSTIDNVLISEANKTINSGQGADFKKASEVEEPEVRSSLDIYNSIYNQISTSLTKDLGTKPEKVDLTETYKALRGQTKESQV